MVIREKRYTVEEFREISQSANQSNRRLELEDGVIIDMGSSKPINTIVAGRIIHFLNAHIIPNHLGYVTVPDGGYKLAHDTVRQPDVAFISKSRQPEIPDEFEIAPDIAVEIVSPREDILKKTYDYLNAGTQLVWAVYCDEKRVHVLYLDTESKLIGQTLTTGDTLTGGSVLPDFTLPISDIFPN